MTAETTYFSLKIAQAAKTGQRSTGQITYRILTDELHQELFITIVDNKGGGWFSNEIVPLKKIEQLLEHYDLLKALPSKTFTKAFVSQSVNNAGFLAAVLRAEELLYPAPEAPRLHLISAEWDDWKAIMLSEPGEIYVPPLSKSELAAVKKAAEKEAIEKSNVSIPPVTKGTKKPPKKVDSEAISVALVDENTDLSTDTDDVIANNELEETDVDTE